MFKKYIMTLLLIVILILSACSATPKANDPFSGSTSLIMDDPFENTNNGSIASEIAIGFRVVSPSVGNQTFIYSGKAIEFEYEYSTTAPCSMGLYIYVDGLLQPYKVLETDTVTTMHKVDLGQDDVKRVKISFIPVNGKKGDTLVLTFANMLNPFVKELNDSVNNFGHDQKISQPMPWHIKVEADGDFINHSISSDYQIKQMELEFKDSFIQTDSRGQRRNKLDNNIFLEVMEGKNKLDGRLSVKKNSKKLSVRAYGNITGRYRISLYADLQPIAINGYDYVDIEIKRDMIASIPFTLDSDSIQKYRNLYAVILPLDLDNDCGLFKSDSLYLAKD